MANGRAASCTSTSRETPRPHGKSLKASKNRSLPCRTTMNRWHQAFEIPAGRSETAVSIKRLRFGRDDTDEPIYSWISERDEASGEHRWTTDEVILLGKGAARPLAPPRGNDDGCKPMLANGAGVRVHPAVSPIRVKTSNGE